MFERPVKVSDAEKKTCIICGSLIEDHSKKSLIRCLYESNIRLSDVSLDLKWLNAERKFGKLPKNQPDRSHLDTLGNLVYTFLNEKKVIIIDKSGEIIDVQELTLEEEYCQSEFIGNLKILIRPKTTDVVSVMEVFKDEVYKKLKITDNDIVLDLGANIGAFSLYANSKHSPQKTYSYEVEPSNFEMLRKNVGNNVLADKINYFNLGVVADNIEKRDLFLDTNCTGCHTMLPSLQKQKILVQCVNIQDVIEKHNPTVVKMDIEGSEYECLKSIKSFKNIRELMLEFHSELLVDEENNEKLNEVIDILKKSFSVVEDLSPTQFGNTRLIYCSK